MRALILGDPSSVHTRAVVQRTLLDFGDEVEVLADNEHEINMSIMPNGVSTYLEKRGFSIVGRLLYGILNRNVLRKQWDLVAIHYAQLPRLLAIPYCTHVPHRLVFFWGSDLLRDERDNKVSSAMKNTLKRRCLEKATGIYTSTQYMRDSFHELYGYGFDDKLGTVRYGSDRIDLISKHKYFCDDIFSRFEIPQNKTIIAVGYNAIPAQQHKEALKAIGQLSEENKSRIHLLLRMTYGGDGGYISSVRAAAERCGCSYTMVSEFLSDEDVADLTLATDIFVHAQTTDASSASVKEHLCAGSIVLNPTWITYPELVESSNYLRYSNFRELTRKLDELLPLDPGHREWTDVVKNREIVLNEASWDKLVCAWREAYGA